MNSRMTDAEWERWIAAFREHPGHTVKVAKIMGCPRNRARLAWYHGWPKQGRPPISQILEMDKSLARAHRGMRESDDAKAEPGEITDSVRALAKHTDVADAVAERNRRRQKALEDSVKTRTQEGMLISISRGNSIALAASTANLLKGAQALSKRMEEQLRLETVPIREAMSLIKSVAIITRMNAEASKQVFEMERLVMGEPDTEVKGGAGGKLSPAEAAEWMRVAMNTVRKYEERKAIRGSGDASQSGRPGETIVVHASSDDDDEDDDDSEDDDEGIGRAG
jgi:hypothetical protein